MCFSAQVYSTVSDGIANVNLFKSFSWLTVSRQKTMFKWKLAKGNSNGHLKNTFCTNAKKAFCLNAWNMNVWIGNYFLLRVVAMFTIHHEFRLKAKVKPLISIQLELMVRSCVQDLQLTSFHFRYSKMTSSKNRWIYRRKLFFCRCKLTRSLFSYTWTTFLQLVNVNQPQFSEMLTVNFWSHNSRANVDGNHLVIQALLLDQENFAQ